jgi:hypothetical protein
VANRPAGKLAPDQLAQIREYLSKKYSTVRIAALLDIPERAIVRHRDTGDLPPVASKKPKLSR